MKIFAFAAQEKGGSGLLGGGGRQWLHCGWRQILWIPESLTATTWALQSLAGLLTGWSGHILCSPHILTFLLNFVSPPAPGRWPLRVSTQQSLLLLVINVQDDIQVLLITVLCHATDLPRKGGVLDLQVKGCSSLELNLTVGLIFHRIWSNWLEYQGREVNVSGNLCDYVQFLTTCIQLILWQSSNSKGASNAILDISGLPLRVGLANRDSY